MSEKNLGIARVVLPVLQDMSLRDWFAGQSISAFLSKCTGPNGAAEAAKMAYIVADAMLTERSKRNA